MAEERHDNIHLTCTADEVIAYDIEDIEDVKVRVWDSPGVRVDDGDEDGTGNDEKYLRDLESAITEELDVVILWVKMNDTRFHRDDRGTFKILTAMLEGNWGGTL